MEQQEWEQLTPEQKKIQLYLEDKSLGDLTVKMGMNWAGE